MRNRLLAAAASGLMAFGQVAPTAVLAQSAAFPRSQLPTSGSPALAGGMRPAAQPYRAPPAPVAPSYQPQPIPADAQTVRVGLGGGSGSDRMLSLPRGKSAVVELPVDARDVLVSNPKVAEVVLSTPRRIYVMGVGAGQTDAVFFDANGRQLLSLNIRVDQDISALSQTLNRILPGSDIRIEGLGDNLILSGQVANSADADRAVRLAQGMVAKPEMVVNMLAVSGSEQVMLKVRVVEVARTVVKQLGVNLSAVYNQVGEPQYMLGRAASYGVNGSLLGGLTGGYNLNTTSEPAITLPDGSKIFTRTSQVAAPVDTAGNPGWNKAQAMLQAFERVGLVRTLAEPNLTAVSGESAKFLAGGEFPVPVSVDNTGRVTAEYKPFGVGLGFTPVVLSSGRISLKISTEVSELTNIGALTIGSSAAGASGLSLSLPGLNVRRAETMVELPSGGGMMIAGLLQSKAKQTVDSLPGVLQLPVLGALFRSRDFLNDETELVVIVTPYLVKPVSPDKLQTPADGLVIASDMQTVLLGRLNEGFGKAAPAAAAAQTYQGPFGYVVD